MAVMMKPALISGCCWLMVTNALACPGLVVDAAWVREPPPGATTAAAYFTLNNYGTEQLTITGVSSSDFGTVTLHETLTIDGQTRMRPHGPIVLAAGGSFAAAPGGVHLMLVDPRQPRAAGADVNLLFTCESGPPLALTAPVRRPSP